MGNQGPGEGESELVDRRADVRPSHQRLAHQHRLHAGRFEPLDVLPAADAALAHDYSIGGNLTPQLQRVSQIDVKGVEIAVVDAHQPGANAQHAGQVGRFI